MVKKNRFFHSKILGKSNYIFHSENSGKAFFHAKIAEKYFSTKKIRNDKENLIFRLIKWGQDFEKIFFEKKLESKIFPREMVKKIDVSTQKILTKMILWNNNTFSTHNQKNVGK